MAWNLFNRKTEKIELDLSNLEQRMAEMDVKIAKSNDDPTSAIYGRLSNSYRSTGLAAFFAAVNLISNSLASLPIDILFERKLVEHPAHNAIYHSKLSKFYLIKQMIWELLMYGESVAYIKRKSGIPYELVYCEHGTFTVEYSQESQYLYYSIPFISKTKIKPEDVIHFRMISEDGFNGKSIRFYAEKVLELAKSTDQAASKYYESGCAVTGILTLKGARRGAKESARKAFQQLHSGNGGSGLVILDDDTDYKQTSSNADSTQMLDSRMFNVIEIARLFNINPVLLGDLSKSSYNSVEQAQLGFITQTLMPYIHMIECELTSKLISDSEHGFTINLNEKALLRGDMSSTSNYLKNLVSSGIITINEARDILGLERLDGADSLIIPFTDIDQNTISDKNNTEINQDEQ